MGDDRGTQIERLEAEIEATRPELEAACDSFLDAAAGCLADFWPEYIDHCIRRAGDAVNEMDPDRLREVKAAVEEVQGRPRDAVQEHLIDDRRELWPHLGSIDELVDATTGAKQQSYNWVGEAHGSAVGVEGHVPQRLSEPMEVAAGAVAVPLKVAGLPVPGSRWKDPSVAVEWTTGMFEALRQYARWADTVAEKARELGRARGARAKDDALTRWNET